MERRIIFHKLKSKIFFSIFITHNLKYFMFFGFNFDDCGLQLVQGDCRALDAAHKLHANANQ